MLFARLGPVALLQSKLVNSIVFLYLAESKLAVVEKQRSKLKDQIPAG